VPTLEILFSLIAAAGSSMAAAVLFDLLRRIARKRQPQEQSYSERLGQLTASLRQASAEVDSVLSELAQVARDRESAVSKLEGQLKDLESKEKTLQERIDHLQALPLPVAEYFAQLTSTGERRSARRDYMLFGAGVLVSTVISVIFFVLQ
jgi:septal ring factor EnvC (AmiA/AmiB activator)